MGMYGIIHTQPCGNLQISMWFMSITVCIGLEVEWGTQNIFNHMYLEDILCLPIVVHGYVWCYPYISMWKHANFHVVLTIIYLWHFQGYMHKGALNYHTLWCI
jgi:hypothetical protein